MSVVPGIHLVSLHSQKGGTGKTSIALSLALAAIKQNMKPLLIDADLSGTSIRDSIHLKSVQDGQSIIEFFRSPSPKRPLEYIATAELTENTDNTKHEISVLLGDSQAGSSLMPLVYKENHSQYLRSRVEALLNDLAKEDKVKVIIFDNSPGDWGLGKSILEIVQHGKLQKNSSVTFNGKCILVSSLDLNDVVSCLQVRESAGGEKFLHVINRSTHTSNIDTNVNAIATNLDEKSALSNKEGYKTLAQILRAKKVNWVCAEDPATSSSYHKHVRGIKLPANIKDLVAALGWVKAA